VVRTDFALICVSLRIVLPNAAERLICQETKILLISWTFSGAAGQD